MALRADKRTVRAGSASRGMKKAVIFASCAFPHSSAQGLQGLELAAAPSGVEAEEVEEALAATAAMSERLEQER